MTDPAAALAVRRLVREARFGALATLDADGGPYASLVAVATDPSGAPSFLISGLARHTRNLAADPRASLLLAAGAAADPMNAPRAGLTGRVTKVGPGEVEAVKARFVARHPDAAGYAGFADFAFCRMAVEGAHLVEGFGRIIDVPGPAILTDWTGAEALEAGQGGVIAHMNADHADAMALYATALLDAPAGEWQMIGIDPEGCEIATKDMVRRLDFTARAPDTASVRQNLVALVQAAREAARAA